MSYTVRFPKWSPAGLLRFTPKHFLGFLQLLNPNHRVRIGGSQDPIYQYLLYNGLACRQQLFNSVVETNSGGTLRYPNWADTLKLRLQLAENWSTDRHISIALVIEILKHTENI